MKPTSKITTSHRGRLAVVYVRQSSVVQVRVHGESTSRQYGLAGTAVQMGWAPGGVLTIDADLGVSGRFGAHRDGFTELLARVCRGEVGAIFAWKSPGSLARPASSPGCWSWPGSPTRCWSTPTASTTWATSTTASCSVSRAA